MWPPGQPQSCSSGRSDPLLHESCNNLCLLLAGWIRPGRWFAWPLDHLPRIVTNPEVPPPSEDKLWFWSKMGSVGGRPCAPALCPGIEQQDRLTELSMWFHFHVSPNNVWSSCALLVSPLPPTHPAAHSRDYSWFHWQATSFHTINWINLLHYLSLH